MKILSGVFTDSDSKLTVMYENEGKLESGIFPISRIEVEKYERVDFPIEIGRNKIAFTATKAEIFDALRQTDIDYAEWKTLKMTGQVKEDFITWHFNRLTIRAEFGT
jgi:hypothetical protein